MSYFHTVWLRSSQEEEGGQGHEWSRGIPYRAGNGVGSRRAPDRKQTIRDNRSRSGEQIGLGAGVLVGHRKEEFRVHKAGNLNAERVGSRNNQVRVCTESSPN